MKPLKILLIFSLLLLFLGSAYAPAGAGKGMVTLTAGQVVSAIEIETAFHQATAEGTRPGLVILDGSQGPFVLTGDDLSVNVFFSNLTLRGTHNAVLIGCGIYIDGSPADNLLIENLVILSKCDGITDNGQIHRKVVIHNNLIRAEGTGIGGVNAVDWTITNNLILAKLDGINFTRPQHLVLLGNDVTAGAIGVFLSTAADSLVMNNTLSGSWQGVLLNRETSRTRVLQNSIVDIQQSGVALEAGVCGNTITGNRVLCAFDAPCLTVDASPALQACNVIKNNRP